MIFETFRQAIQNVWSNKLRTFLTMLGIIIGVMAVIVIVGLGNGMTKSMRDSFSALGTNTLSIQVWGYGSRSVSVEEMYDICQRHSDLIKAVSPQVNFSGKASGTLKIGTTSYRWSNMSGVDENFTEMKNYQIVQGRGLQYMDMQDNKQVCVIGDYLNRVAFGGNGVGQTLKIGANKFRVVGVLSAKVSDPTMQQGSDDDCVYLPYTTVMRLSSQSMVDCYTAMMADESLANEAKSTMEEELMSILKTENGLLCVQRQRVAGGDERDDQHGHRDTYRHCQHLAAGGRHRHYEHHAGVCDRAHPRDRHPQGAGRKGAHHSGAVCGGSSHYLGAGRRFRHCAGLCGVHGGKQGAAHVHDRYHCYGKPLLQLHCGGLWHLGGHRRAVRLSAGAARSPAEPH
mgnify:CR=1 FL=1